MTDLIVRENNLPQLELEIKFYLGQTAQNIIEVGKRLIQAKALVAHGGWQQWLEKNFQLSQNTAGRFMQVTERFSNSATSQNLNQSQMIALLSLPSAEETEKFIEEKTAEGKQVAEMTIKELRKEIDAYKKAIEDNKQSYQQSLFDKDEAIDTLQKELDERPTVAPEDYQQTKDDLAKANIELGKAQAANELQAENFKRQSEEAQAQFDKEKKKWEDKLDKADKKIKRLERKSYTPPTELPTEDFKLICADIRGGLSDIADNSIDFIITDPPYPKEYLPLYADLSKLAARVLKDGGSLICMTGQSYLPEVIQLLASDMQYHWCLCYSTPGQKTQLWQRHLHTAWKPLLWFVKGDYKGDWLGSDVMTSPSNDKRFHEWGQSLGGMEDVIERLTNPNDLILDPFLGGGTTGLAALLRKRKFIGVDIEQKNVDTANQRITEAFNASNT